MVVEDLFRTGVTTELRQMKGNSIVLTNFLKRTKIIIARTLEFLLRKISEIPSESITSYM